MVEAGYILASVPDLLFDIDSVVPEQYSIEDFIVSCEIILSEDDARSIRIAIENPAESSLAIAQEWHNFVESIQHESARLRWTKVKSGIFPQIKGGAVSAEAIKMASSTAQSETPLQAQLVVFSTLWDILEALDSQYQRSKENLAIYAWKLQLLSKLVQFRKKRGKKTWGQLVSSITQKAGFSPTAISGGIENEH